MAAPSTGKVAKLTDLPADFSVSFLRNADVSLKSKQKGFKYFSESFFHSVSTFRSQEAEECISVSARCYRSQRKTEVPHTLNMDVKPSEISYAHCSCQAGVVGSCSHIVGLIIALQQWQLMGFTEVPSQLSCTSLPEQWSVPRGRKIQPVDVPHLIFVNPKPDRKKRPIQNTLTDCRKIKVKKEDLEHLKALKNCPLAYLVSSPQTTLDTHVGPVPLGSGLSTHATFFEPANLQPVVTQCGNLVFPRASQLTTDNSTSMGKSISQEQCEAIEEKTRAQAQSHVWMEERKHRLTLFGTILKRRSITDKFLNTLSCPKQFTSPQTSYGTNNEKIAIEMYIKKTGYHVHDCGLIINPNFPFLGASPDGKVCDNNSITGLIEIKCPFSARDMLIKDATILPNFCLKENIDKELCLKTDHRYYYQIQGQLLTSGAPFCDLVVYTRKEIFIERILPNHDFMQQLLNDLTKFYCDYMQPYLNSQV